MHDARSRSPRGARNNERAYAAGFRGAEGAGRGAYAEYRKLGRNARYQGMLDRALEVAGPKTSRRDLRRMGSDFNSLYAAAERDNWKHTRYGAYHRLLVHLELRERKAPPYGAGNTPRGGKAPAMVGEPFTTRMK